ncbi:iron uptake porin [Pleurocapsales cyanobacterium LEGE 10410]|nr:iron uptake porin [Pleurocapsales cyanobacterium LEGE 10410]
MTDLNKYLLTIPKFFLVVAGSLWTALLLLSDEATANPNQFVPVHQLSDISPTDWRARGLKSLSDRTLCLGENYQLSDRALTRYEFAAGMQQCLDQISNRSLSDEINLSPGELSFIARIEREFEQELTVLAVRIDNLAVRTERLEEQRFSTTTKLNGEVLFQLGDSFGADDSSQLFTGYRARLNFDTSFYGSDRLRIRLGARNTGELEEVADTFMVRLGVDGQSDNEIETEISYDFAVRERLQVVLGINSVGADDVAEVLNPLSSSGQGAVSRFGRRNPATLRGPGGAGGGIQYEFSDAVTLSLGYFADSDDAANADAGTGLFGASFSAVGQVLIEPVEDLEMAFTYTRTYFREDEARLAGATGSKNANEPFEEDPTSADNFGFQINWELSDRLEVGGWLGYTAAQSEIDNESATILNTAVTLAFPDLGKEGSEAGIIIGVPPIVTQHDNSEVEDERTSLHLETFYRYQINDNIAITPGIFLVTQPDHSDRDSILVGTIRTRFRF